MDYAWTCHCCGKQFNGLPMDYGFDAPLYWHQIPEAERSDRARLDSDVCVIDGTDFFIRGCIELPVVGLEQRFVWGAWVSLSRDSMDRAFELWNEPVILDEPPRFGWLSNEIRSYPSTLNLKTDVYFRGGNQRPVIGLWPVDHPLFVEQRDGMSIERVQEIAAQLMHRH
jgi:hypothetical protein